jgi:PAS domain S-box-containing protein
MTVVAQPERALDAVSKDYGKLFRSLFEDSGLCMAILDRQLKVLEGNAAFVNQFGLHSPDAYLRTFFDLLHPSVRQHMQRQFARLTSGHGPRFAERVVALRVGGPPFAGMLTGVAVPGERGIGESVLVVMRPERSEHEGSTVNPNKIMSDLDARILEGVAAGMPTIQLASRLYLSRQGVEYHVSAMLRKFKVPNRTALVSKAYALGILSTGSWPPKASPEFVH